ncbi:hypothetical protein FBQ96_03325 [Nitrospirales bacterium NOB]|nr:MAG: hypothetical protein UZ03_NOB001002323 [Nitrospira sp. OLB3]MBV6470405.1 hypothetical protein [Nitrospirota bacterium]MCE7965890.1 hypothetical protein [Nitrospira sp. NTP2]MCK6500189.1 hypothetical protein [Nitrospira sp.]MDL1888609.1 hypothetical protein [Nitrospirales bacterium NOB]MEB2339590.1 hypothetical protein [Nitrospirales bacterium]
MKMTSVRRGRKSAQKKKTAGPKLRISWAQFGLIDPALESKTVSMDQIRREVTALASVGIGEDTRIRSEQTLRPVGRTGRGRHRPSEE